MANKHVCNLILVRFRNLICGRQTPGQSCSRKRYEKARIQIEHPRSKVTSAFVVVNAAVDR